PPRRRSRSGRGASSSWSWAPVRVFGTAQRYRPQAMPELEIQPCCDEHLDTAAGMLEQRHARHRESEPLLVGEFDFRAEIGTLLAQEGADGVVALREGRVVGYLVGTPRDA